MNGSIIGLWWLWILIIVGLGYALHRWTMEQVAGVMIIGVPVFLGTVSLIGLLIERALK